MWVSVDVVAEMTTLVEPDRHLDRNFLPIFCGHVLGLDSTKGCR
jgi:hypothetical protein